MLVSRDIYKEREDIRKELRKLEIAILTKIRDEVLNENKQVKGVQDLINKINKLAEAASNDVIDNRLKEIQGLMQSVMPDLEQSLAKSSKKTTLTSMVTAVTQAVGGSKGTTQAPSVTYKGYLDFIGVKHKIEQVLADESALNAANARRDSVNVALNEVAQKASVILKVVREATSGVNWLEQNAAFPKYENPEVVLFRGRVNDLNVAIDKYNAHRVFIDPVPQLPEISEIDLPRLSVEDLSQQQAQTERAIRIQQENLVKINEAENRYHELSEKRAALQTLPSEIAAHVISSATKQVDDAIDQFQRSEMDGMYVVVRSATGVVEANESTGLVPALGETEDELAFVRSTLPGFYSELTDVFSKARAWTSEVKMHVDATPEYIANKKKDVKKYDQEVSGAVEKGKQFFIDNRGMLISKITEQALPRISDLPSFNADLIEERKALIIAQEVANKRLNKIKEAIIAKQVAPIIERIKADMTRQVAPLDEINEQILNGYIIPGLAKDIYSEMSSHLDVKSSDRDAYIDKLYQEKQTNYLALYRVLTHTNEYSNHLEKAANKLGAKISPTLQKKIRETDKIKYIITNDKDGLGSARPDPSAIIARLQEEVKRQRADKALSEYRGKLRHIKSALVFLSRDRWPLLKTKGAKLHDKIEKTLDDHMKMRK
jgi:hypothetical protein